MALELVLIQMLRAGQHGVISVMSKHDDVNGLDHGACVIDCEWTPARPWMDPLAVQRITTVVETSPQVW